MSPKRNDPVSVTETASPMSRSRRRRPFATSSNVAVHRKNRKKPHPEEKLTPAKRQRCDQQETETSLFVTPQDLPDAVESLVIPKFPSLFGNQGEPNRISDRDLPAGPPSPNSSGFRTPTRREYSPESGPPTPNAPLRPYHKCSLKHAIFQHDREAVRRCVQECDQDPNEPVSLPVEAASMFLSDSEWERSRNRSMPIVVAAQCSTPAVVQQLLEDGAEVNAVNVEEQNALHCLCLQYGPDYEEEATGEFSTPVSCGSIPSSPKSPDPQASVFLGLKQFLEKNQCPSSEIQDRSTIASSSPADLSGETTAVSPSSDKEEGLETRISTPKRSRHSVASPECNSRVLQCKRRLFSDGVDPEFREEELAVTTEILLLNGIHYTSLDMHGRAPLDYACQYGHPKVADAIRRAEDRDRREEFDSLVSNRSLDQVSPDARTTSKKLRPRRRATIHMRRALNEVEVDFSERINTPPRVMRRSLPSEGDFHQVEGTQGEPSSTNEETIDQRPAVATGARDNVPANVAGGVKEIATPGPSTLQPTAASSMTPGMSKTAVRRPSRRCRSQMPRGKKAPSELSDESKLAQKLDTSTDPVKHTPETSKWSSSSEFLRSWILPHRKHVFVGKDVARRTPRALTAAFIGSPSVIGETGE